ncbi:hypothetical protein ACH5RR_031034 [Cinchona calisaya]|uniref:Uncharacterized protein n=1 Tax=Cinchona calisaya TaxID=153742 RepID=A0ABD2YIF5_9GENT
MVFSKLLGSALGAFVAMSFSRFLGSEGRAIMITGRNLMLFGILIFSTIFLFRLSSLSLNRKSGFLLFFLFLSIFFLISLFGCFLRIYLLSHFGLFFGNLLSFILVCSVGSGGGQPLPLPAPSGGSSSSSWMEDSFGIDVLLESWSKSTEGGSTETGTSVNQPEASPPANAVAPRGDEAGPSNQPPRVVPYPYQPDEVAHPAPNQEEVASLQRELHALIQEMVRDESERGVGPLSAQFPEQRELNSETARQIIVQLELDAETNVNNLREWAGRLREDKNLLKTIIREYLPRR